VNSNTKPTGGPRSAELGAVGFQKVLWAFVRAARGPNVVDVRGIKRSCIHALPCAFGPGRFLVLGGKRTPLLSIR